MRPHPGVILGLALLSASPTSFAATDPGNPPTRETAPEAALSLARQALKRADEVEIAGWAYTLTTVEDGRKTVEKHNPSRPAGQRWELVLKRDQPPDPKQLEEYAKERRHQGSGRPNLREMVEGKSLELLAEERERMTFRFRMKADEDEAKLMGDKMRGTLVVRRDGPDVESLEIVNTGRISKFGVLNMSEFLTRLTFRPAPGRPGMLMETVTARVRGRALMVKSLDVDSLATFSDYHWVGVVNTGDSPSPGPAN